MLSRYRKYSPVVVTWLSSFHLNVKDTSSTPSIVDHLATQQLIANCDPLSWNIVILSYKKEENIISTIEFARVLLGMELSTLRFTLVDYLHGIGCWVMHALLIIPTVLIDFFYPTHVTSVIFKSHHANPIVWRVFHALQPNVLLDSCKIQYTSNASRLFILLLISFCGSLTHNL